MRIPFAVGAYKRTAGRFPEVVQTNLLPESSPTDQEEGIALLARPGLTAFTTVGTAPIRGIKSRPGMFNGDTIVVANDTVYRVTSTGVATALSGTVAGFDRVRIDIGRNDADEDIARIATGDELYVVDETSVTAEDFPDATQPGCTDIVYHLQHWFGVEAGTDKVYFQIPGATTWTALEFVSAEYEADRIVFIRSRGEQLIFGGSDTTEVWALSGQADPAVVPYGGQVWNYGCRARDTAVTIGDTLLWVDNRNSVRLFDGGEPVIVSDHGLAEELGTFTDAELRAWGFSLHQHTYYVLTCGDMLTAVYDLVTKKWTRFTSSGETYWLAHLGTDAGGLALAADAVTNQIYQVDGDALDDDGSEIVAEWTAYLELNEGRLEIANVVLDMSIGFVDLGETNPLIGLRISRDGGQNYGDVRYIDLPLTGEFRHPPRWNRCGQFRAPHGVWLKFNTSDLGVKRISGVRGNVP